MASHTVRAFLDAHQREGRSSYAIFVDIKEAFYRVIRQHAIQASCSDTDIMIFLKRMGITDLHLQDVASLFEAGPAISSMEVKPHLAAMISEIHRDTVPHAA